MDGPSCFAAGRVTCGRLYAAGEKVVIFSNMDTNDQDEWGPIVEALSSRGYMALTYAYPCQADDQSGVLHDAVAFVRSVGAEKIVLVGASRGGVATVKVATDNRPGDWLAGLAAISAPISSYGATFYSDDELRRIRVPMLLINSERDMCVEGTCRMPETVVAPKELVLYPGESHGTEIFNDSCESLVEKLAIFVERVL
ncbi:MAG: hypothetical protein LBD10_00350 [Desulfobulbus sp.]|jgi:pimeloyl-ACP methyl ester carboxylesterase|uniref:alpha/beta hydrolase n=1 Tax=Desulfobulbus sp. TaxID=895 RepID=UPI00284E4E64|nr:hypothetical protein [Desulfobulbus sp.]MDR2548652.1 hypothetical protein [Desulfobulbus sp.]